VAVTFGCVLTPKIFGPMASPEAVQTHARRAEALGFDSVYGSVRATTARTMLRYAKYDWPARAGGCRSGDCPTPTGRVPR